LSWTKKNALYEGRDPRKQAEADDGRRGLDPLGLREDVLELAADGVGALERGRRRELDVHEEIPLVLLGYEARRQLPAENPVEESEPDEDGDGR